jgi:hypothetical protein
MRSLLTAVLLLAAGGGALGQGADVGLVNMVVGDVVFVPLAGAPGRAQAFMKVREGDRFNVSSGGQVRVVYFDGSRQERWAGPASFRAGRKAGEPITGRPAEVASLPAGVPQRIARVPELVQNAKLGGIQVRGGLSRSQPAAGDSQAAVAEARAAYAQMKKDMPADDITPELFLYAALHEHSLYDDMKAVVDEMLRKQPGNADAQALADWVRGRAGR